MEIRLKPISANDWSGIQRYPNCYDALGPYLTRSGSIYTGLTKEDEKRLGDDLGYDLRKNSSFWDTFRIKVGTEDVVLDLEDPADELKYIFLKSHRRVKATLTENKATANYYLHNPDQEAEVFNDNNRLKRKASKEFDKLKPVDIRKALRLFGFNSVNVSDAVAEDRLYAIMERNPAHFISKWVDNKHCATEFLLKEAQAQNVVKKNKNSFLYESITLGNTLEEAILFIDNAENSDIKASILNEANIK